jgi:hypothetical protein
MHLRVRAMTREVSGSGPLRGVGSTMGTTVRGQPAGH